MTNEDHRQVSLFQDVILGREACTLSPGGKAAAHFPTQLCHRLQQARVLDAHQGCVNRLAWNKAGTMLASGSDDRKVMLWSYPDSNCGPIRIHTQHDLNIFGVQFLPFSNDTKIVTCAFDRTVQLHRLDGPASFSSRSSSGPGRSQRQEAVSCQTTVYSNHSECVKDVVVEDGNAHCFWSAGEDGRVHQFDTRSADDASPDAHNMLIRAPSNRSQGGALLEFKALDINQSRPWLMATACSDQFVRVYDRRMLSLRSPTSSTPTPSLLRLAPMHMLLNASQPYYTHTTCVRFSNKGDRLVANYHCEQAYTFDVTSADAPPTVQYRCYTPDFRALRAATRELARLDPARRATPAHELPHSRAGYELKRAANECMMDDKAVDAVRLYDRLLQRDPWSASGYAGRAIVLLARRWKGDLSQALKDADTCVALSPGWTKGYEVRIRTLEAMHQTNAALWELKLFEQEFPEHSDTTSMAAIAKRLKDAKAAEREARKKAQRGSGAASTSNAGERRRRHRFGPPQGTQSAEQWDLEPADASGVNRPWHGRRTTADTNDIPDSLMNADSSRSDGAGGSAAASPWGDEQRCELDGPQAKRNLFSLPSFTSCDVSVPGRWSCGNPDWAIGERLSQGVRPSAVDAAFLSGDRSGGEPGAGPRRHDASLRAARAQPLDAIDEAAPAGEGGRPLAFTGSAGAPPEPSSEQQLSAGLLSEAAAGGWGGAEVRSGGADSGSASPASSRPVVRPPSWRAQGNDGSSEPQSSSDDAADAAFRSSAPVGPRQSASDLDEGMRGGDNGAKHALGAVCDEDMGGGDRAASDDDADEDDAIGGDLCSCLYGHVPWPREPFNPRIVDCTPTPEPPTLQVAVAHAMRMSQRFVGHCNKATDIKEAVFIGADDAVVACGSDCGHVFLYDAVSGQLLRTLKADADVVNCVQCHPRLPVLATSGLENVVKLWEASDWEREEDNGRRNAVVERNQGAALQAPTIMWHMQPQLLDFIAQAAQNNNNPIGCNTS